MIYLKMRLILCTILFSLAQLCFAQVERDGFHIVDFGAPGSEIPINTIMNTGTGTRQEIPSTIGCDDGLEIVIVDDFAGVNNSGTQQADPALELPASLTGDSFFGHMGTFNGGTNPSAAIEVHGVPALNGQEVTLGFFASRIGNGNRQTCYTVYAQDTVVVCLDPNNNVDQIVEATISNPIEVDSTGFGLIRIEMTAGPENDTPERFFYLGGLTIMHGFTNVTNMIDISLDPLCNDRSPVFEVGDVITLNGKAVVPCQADLALLIDGIIYDTIFNSFINFGYDWTVPNILTSNARLALVNFGPQGQRGVYSISQPFSIVEPTDPCSIVVLGSSTAAGTGPSTPDSAWVNRYQQAYAGCDSRINVINLSRGGYNTFNLLPNDGVIPTGINQTIDSARNITAALALNPQAIIINLPSNDAASGYDVAQQLANYDQMLAAAGNVPVYVSTPQPRNFGAAQVAIQRELLDSTFARFGERAIDFWTPFATSDGLLDPAFDSGDGVHINDAAHRILWDRVVAKQIDTLLSCRPIANSIFTPATVSQLSLKLVPNPTQGDVLLTFTLPQAGRVDVKLVSLDGKHIQRLSSFAGFAGSNELSIKRDSLPVGMYVVHLEVKSSGSEGGKYVGTTKLLVH